MDAIPSKRFCLRYKKQGPASFISALDLSGVLEASFRRSRIPILFSGGFHPRPLIHFEDPLPLGWESEWEKCWVELGTNYPAQEMKKRLAASLPAGIELIDCFQSGKKPRPSLLNCFQVSGLTKTWDDSCLPQGVSYDLHANGSVLFRLDFRQEKKVFSMKKVLKELGLESLEGLVIVRKRPISTHE